MSASRDECCHGDLRGRCLLCDQAATIEELRELLRACEPIIASAERAWVRSVIGGLYQPGRDTPYTELLRKIVHAVPRS